MKNKRGWSKGKYHVIHPEKYIGNKAPVNGSS